jgi:hypothetical protein
MKAADAALLDVLTVRLENLLNEKHMLHKVWAKK